MYADDTQRYVSLDPGNKADIPSLQNLEHCIQLWMTSKFVNLNEDKINIIYGFTMLYWN